ncbi:MAG: hypothetical protein IPG50_09490 [Myxococcales bacterium]|nr:hypothetical protein [Myxococcales bacterium]
MTIRREEPSKARWKGPETAPGPDSIPIDPNTGLPVTARGATTPYRDDVVTETKTQTANAQSQRVEVFANIRTKA